MTIRSNRKGRFKKSLFLTTSLLRGRFLKDDGEQGGATADDGMEVGAGFAEAADRMSGDDTRTPEEKGGGAAQQTDDDGADGDDNGDDDNSDEGEDGADKKAPKPKRATSTYIRDLKRENRELKRERATYEQRFQALENSRSTTPNAGDNTQDTGGKPDADDAKKYPLGVLDDGYIEDMIDWTAEQKVQAALSRDRQTEQAKAETQRAESHQAALREKMDTLTDKGAEEFEDFEETVIETGLRGDWKLTETTFTAAAEASHGAAILHALANDKDEAKRVSELSPYQQMKYVADKDAAIEAKKPKARTKPAAGVPPSSMPAGRNSSAPIRADTDNLDDFRKLFYKKQ